MNYKLKLILKFIIIIVLIISCDSKQIIKIQEKPLLPKEEFRIPIKRINQFEGSHSYTLNFKSKVLRPYWSSYCNFMFTHDKSDHYFRNSELEIEFQSYVFDEEIEFYKPGFSIIGCKIINKELMGFAILWVNKKQNTKDFLKKSNSVLQISNKIDVTTDTVFTTLSKKNLLKLYSNFKGIYYELKLDSISWEKIDQDRYEFYNSITFHDFKFGIGVKTN